MAVTALVPAIETIDAAMVGTTPEDTLIFHKEPWILPLMMDICDRWLPRRTQTQSWGERFACPVLLQTSCTRD